jgi:hypothetical protein
MLHKQQQAQHIASLHLPSSSFVQLQPIRMHLLHKCGGGSGIK